MVTLSYQTKHISSHSSLDQRAWALRKMPSKWHVYIDGKNHVVCVIHSVTMAACGSDNPKNQRKTKQKIATIQSEQSLLFLTVIMP